MHQKLNRQAYLEAHQVIRDLHKLVGRPGENGLSVGEMVRVAAQMGLLQTQEKAHRGNN